MNEAPPRSGDLVPELAVRDLAASLTFRCDLCGFAVAYERPERRFACLQRGTARVMLTSSVSTEAGSPLPGSHRSAAA